MMQAASTQRVARPNIPLPAVSRLQPPTAPPPRPRPTFSVLQHIKAGNYFQLSELSGGQGNIRLVAIPIDEAAPPFPVCFKEANPGSEHLLARETAILSKLSGNHNVPLLYGAELGENSARIAMEYLEGETLDSALEQRGGRLPVQEAVNLAYKIAQAVASIHARGILHLDLKPRNIMVEDRDVRVFDFGISREKSPTSTYLSENLECTLAYAAPEQLETSKITESGEEHTLDERTDVYQLSVVLYEMLSGCLPFQGRNVGETFINTLNKNPRPLPADIPPALKHIIEIGMAKKAGDRYISCHALANALKATGLVESPHLDPPRMIDIVNAVLPPKEARAELREKGEDIWAMEVKDGRVLCSRDAQKYLKNAGIDIEDKIIYARNHFGTRNPEPPTNLWNFFKTLFSLIFTQWSPSNTLPSIDTPPLPPKK